MNPEVVAPDRVERFLADIADSPAALARLLDAPAPERVAGDRRICLTGLGSSRFAADIVAAQRRSEGWTIWSELASGTERTAPAADLTLVAISASGSTPEVVDAARRHQGTSRVIAVTNDQASPLAAAADTVVLMHAGREASGIACRTFRATIAALAILTGSSASELRKLSEALAIRLASARAWADKAAPRIDGAPAIDVLASGALVGLAEQAALMLREAPRLPAHAFDTADWLHVGIYLAWPGHVLLRLPGSAAHGPLEQVVSDRHVDLVDTLALEYPDAGAEMFGTAILGSVDAELLAAVLWTRTSATTGSQDDKAP